MNFYAASKCFDPAGPGARPAAVLRYYGTRRAGQVSTVRRDGMAVTGSADGHGDRGRAARVPGRDPRQPARAAIHWQVTGPGPGWIGENYFGSTTT